MSGTGGKGEEKDSGIEVEDDSSGILKHKSTVMYSLERKTKIKLPNNMESYNTQPASITFHQFGLQKNNRVLYLLSNYLTESIQE